MTHLLITSVAELTLLAKQTHQFPFRNISFPLVQIQNMNVEQKHENGLASRCCNYRSLCSSNQQRHLPKNSRADAGRFMTTWSKCSQALTSKFIFSLATDVVKFLPFLFLPFWIFFPTAARQNKKIEALGNFFARK
jgi:hypothetical protein